MDFHAFQFQLIKTSVKTMKSETEKECASKTNVTEDKGHYQISLVSIVHSTDLQTQRTHLSVNQSNVTLERKCS